MSVKIDISPGELIDKITILEIKSERMDDAEKLKNVRFELDVLTTCMQEQIADVARISALHADLKTINEALWDIEDDIRDCERQQDFGAEFVRLARAVYVTNDKRAAVKKQINVALGSDLVEEKSYVAY